MLILDDPNTWPAHIMKQLYSDSVKYLLKSNDFMDYICEESVLLDIFADVRQYALSDGIAGYHCTKQLPERPYKTSGLRVLDYETHHSDFLEYAFNYPEIDNQCFDQIEKTLAEWRNDPSDTRQIFH